MDADVEPEPCRDCMTPIPPGWGWCDPCDRKHKAEALAKCHLCSLPVAFIGHHGDIPTHLAPFLNPGLTREAVDANRDHDAIPEWR